MSLHPHQQQNFCKQQQPQLFYITKTPYLLNFNINIDIIPSDNKDSQNVPTDAAFVPAFFKKGINKKQRQKRVNEQLNNNLGLQFDRQKYGTENVKEKNSSCARKQIESFTTTS